MYNFVWVVSLCLKLKFKQCYLLLIGPPPQSYKNLLTKNWKQYFFFLMADHSLWEFKKNLPSNYLAQIVKKNELVFLVWCLEYDIQPQSLHLYQEDGEGRGRKKRAHCSLHGIDIGSNSWNQPKNKMFLNLAQNFRTSNLGIYWVNQPFLPSSVDLKHPFRSYFLKKCFQ